MDMNQIEKLGELNKLKEKGILTEEEFAKQKNLILSESNQADNKDVSMWSYFVECLTDKYASFSGRARRKEYFSFVLFVWLFNLLLNIIVLSVAGEDAMNLISSIYSLLLFLPQLSVLVRRLHDVNMSGWWILTLIVPMIVIFFKSDTEKNKYGSVPAGIATGIK